MRRVDTVSFLSEFLGVRAAPLMGAFRDWALAHDFLRINHHPQADHFSYRCSEVCEYDEIRRRFEEHAGAWTASRFIYQAVKSGRRVAVIGLVKPIPTPFGDLRVLELSEPSPVTDEALGFDHIEIFPTIGNAEEIAASLNGSADAGLLDGRFNLPKFKLRKGLDHATWDAMIVSNPSRHHRQDFILRLTSGPVIERLAARMR